MTILDDETLQMYVEESKEHLETIESDLLVIEQGGEAIDEDLVNKLREGPNNLLVLAPDEVKDGDRVIKTIDFLNGIPAFVIIESRPEIKGRWCEEREIKQFR